MKYPISKREQEILHLIAHENSTKMIAQELYISEHTVVSHRKNLKNKLNAANTAGLVRRAYEFGLLKLSRQLLSLLLLCCMCALHAQQETEIRSDGIVVPRATVHDIVSPVEGMFFYSTDEDAYMYYDGTEWSIMGSDSESITSFDSLFIERVLRIGDNHMIYELDTSTMTISRDGDTLFHIGNRLETSKNFRFANSDTTGAVLVRTTDNPSIRLFDEDMNESVEIYSHFANASPERNPRIVLTHHDENGDEVSSIQLNSNYSGTNDSRIVTDEIQIDGGSDLAELFDITSEESLIEPGMIVSLDPDQPGKLMLSNRAYDKKVAGVISGANGIKPGILMGQDETIATGDDLVTLSGRTYVMANTSNGAIEVGDPITTSNIAGEAMRAKNKRKSQGSIIGKAMTPLKEGSGYVLVLVNLQ